MGRGRNQEFHSEHMQSLNYLVNNLMVSCQFSFMQCPQPSCFSRRLKGIFADHLGCLCSVLSPLLFYSNLENGRDLSQVKQQADNRTSSQTKYFQIPTQWHFCCCYSEASFGRVITFLPAQNLKPGN